MLPPSAQPWYLPPSGCVALGQQPDLSELLVPWLKKGPQEAHCKLLHISICPHCQDGETEAQKGERATEVSSVLCCTHPFTLESPLSPQGPFESPHGGPRLPVPGSI